MVAGEGKCWPTPSLEDSTIGSAQGITGASTKGSTQGITRGSTTGSTKVLLGLLLEVVLAGVLEVFVGCY